MTFSFEKLRFYQNDVDFADSVCAHTEFLPRSYGFLVDQFNRAALSIAAKNRAGVRREQQGVDSGGVPLSTRACLNDSFLPR